MPSGLITPGSGSSAAGSGSSAWYGDGSDGAGTFDGATVVAGITPAANVYTMLRDLYLSSAAISAGVQIRTNGFRLFCSGTITGAAATSIIQYNGNTAASATAGNALTNTNGSLSGFAGGYIFGGAGGNGGTAAGSAGTNFGASIFGTVRGGAGGTGASGAGGASGTINAPTTNFGGIRSLYLTSAYLGSTGLASASAQGGGSGGGGGGGDTTNAGGGGGGGGGVVFVFAQTFAGSGAIQARGGAGFSPTLGNTGGGGGGGGGWVQVVSRSVSAGAISGWTIDAAGGAAGALHGTGTAGTGGGTGIAVLIPG